MSLSQRERWGLVAALTLVAYRLYYGEWPIGVRVDHAEGE